MYLNKISFVILAGGKSSRMGRDKLELKFDGISFLDILIGKANELQSAQIIVAGKASNRQGVLSVPDEITGRGPLGGIHAGLKAARYPYCFVISGDVPQISISTIRALAGTHSTGRNAITLLQHGGRIEPLIGMYNTNLHESIKETITEAAVPVFAYLDKTGFATYDFKGNDREVYNINTLQDYVSMSEYYNGEEL